MQRISTLNRVLNLFDAGKDGFKNGDLASGILPTEFNAAWCNGIQEELANVVEAGGLALNGGSVVQLLAALRSAGVFQTAAQFDSTTKAATTAFVQAIGLKAAARYALTVTGSIPATNVGSSFIVNSAVATTQTLPAANSVPPGSRISLINIGVGIASIARGGADVLYVNVGFVTSLIMGSGDTLVLESNGTNGWDVNGGSVQLQYSAAFGSSLGASGFKKYPDPNSPTGYSIEQWGNMTCSAAIGNTAVSFPIQFPNACRSIAFGFVLTAAQNFYACGWNSKTLAGFNVFNPQAQSAQHDWRAIGY